MGLTSARRATSRIVAGIPRASAPSGGDALSAGTPGDGIAIIRALLFGRPATRAGRATRSRPRLPPRRRRRRQGRSVPRTAARVLRRGGPNTSQDRVHDPPTTTTSAANRTSQGARLPPRSVIAASTAADRGAVAFPCRRGDLGDTAGPAVRRHHRPGADRVLELPAAHGQQVDPALLRHEVPAGHRTAVVEERRADAGSQGDADESPRAGKPREPLPGGEGGAIVDEDDPPPR